MKRKPIVPKAGLNQKAEHVIPIYLQLAPPVGARDWDRFILEMLATEPANTRESDFGYRWRFIAGGFSVSCDANHDAASALRERLRKRARSYANNHNRLPAKTNTRQYTAAQYDAAVKRTPELES